MRGGRVCSLDRAVAFRPRLVLPAGQFHVFISLLASLQVCGGL